MGETVTLVPRTGPRPAMMRVGRAGDVPTERDWRTCRDGLRAGGEADDDGCRALGEIGAGVDAGAHLHDFKVPEAVTLSRLCRSSLSQLSFGAPLMYIEEPLSAMIMP